MDTHPEWWMWLWATLIVALLTVYVIAQRSNDSQQKRQLRRNRYVTG